MCEDYPCCGHEAGECGQIEDARERDARFYAMVSRQQDYDYYGDDYDF